jgi:hypothetical protein
MMHFREFPEHWESVTREMKLKLRMFRNRGPGSNA